MSELFLERSAEVLDDWEAVRHDGPRHDAMRWSPDAAPRRTWRPPGLAQQSIVVPPAPVIEQVTGVWIGPALGDEGDMVYLGGGEVRLTAAVPSTFDSWQGRVRQYHSSSASLVVSCNARPFLEAARSLARAMQQITDSLGVAQVGFVDLLRALQTPRHDRHHPPPLPVDGREYRRRRRARARRRR